MSASTIALGAFAAFIAIATLTMDLRRRKHKGMSQEKFIRVFADEGISREIPEVVYNFYSRSWFFGNLAISPDDSLEGVLNKGEEDVEDDGMLLMKRLRLKPPSEEVRQHWNEEIRLSRGRSQAPVRLSMDLSQSAIRTVRDMVLWLDWVTQHQESTR